MDKKLIPKGVYCYTCIDNKFVYCPYFSTIEDEGVKITYCKFLKQGDMGNITNREFDTLVKKYGSEENLWKKYPLGLLWDSCKECGENNET